MCYNKNQANQNKTMKKLLILFMTLLLSSCAVTNYYQVYKTNSESGILKNDKIVFEDKNCSVSYDLWSEGGDIGFSIYNKTESDMTINLNKTFFVLNGVAYEYFQNRTFTKTQNSGTTVSSYNYPYYWNYNVTKVAGTSSTSFSTSYIEKSILTIPSKTSINISEFQITNSRYVNCDLIKSPSNKNIKTLKFDNDNSPFVFYNLITYTTKSDTSRLENKFYVSEITNYPSSEMFDKIDTSMCGRILNVPFVIFKDAAPDKFYIQYSTEK